MIFAVIAIAFFVLAPHVPGTNRASGPSNVGTLVAIVVGAAFLAMAILVAPYGQVFN